MSVDLYTSVDLCTSVEPCTAEDMRIAGSRKPGEWAKWLSDKSIGIARRGMGGD